MAKAKRTPPPAPSERIRVRWKKGWTAVPNRIIRSATLSRSSRLLWCVLASFAGLDEDEHAYPTQERIAELCADGDGQAPHRRTIRRWTLELWLAGWLTIYRTRAGNEYELHEPDPEVVTMRREQYEKSGDTDATSDVTPMPHLDESQCDIDATRHGTSTPRPSYHDQDLKKKTHPTQAVEHKNRAQFGAPDGAGAAGAAGGAGAPGWGPVGGIGDDDQAPDGAGGWGGADAPWEPAPGGAGDSPLPSSARVSPTADEEDDDRPYYAESERLLREVIKASAWREFTDVPPAVVLEIWQDKQSANAPRGAFVKAMRAYKEQAAQGTAEPVANAGIRAILAERAAEAAVPPPAPAAPPATEDLQLELDWTRIGQVRNALYRELAQIGQHPEDFAVIAWPTASHPYGCYVIPREDLIGAYRTIEPAIRRQIAIVAGCAGMAYELIVQIGDPRTLPPPPSSPTPRGPQRTAQRATEDASEPAPPALAAWQEKPRWAPHSQAWLEFANETAEPGRPDWNRQRLCSYMRGAEYRDGWLWSHRVQDQLNGKYRMLVWRVLQEQGLEATPPGERKEPIPGPGDDEPRDMSRFGWGARKAG